MSKKKTVRELETENRAATSRSQEEIPAEVWDPFDDLEQELGEVLALVKERQPENREWRSLLQREFLDLLVLYMEIFKDDR